MCHLRFVSVPFKGRKWHTYEYKQKWLFVLAVSSHDALYKRNCKQKMLFCLQFFDVFSENRLSLLRKTCVEAVKLLEKGVGSKLFGNGGLRSVPRKNDGIARQFCHLVVQTVHDVVHTAKDKVGAAYALAE